MVDAYPKGTTYVARSAACIVPPYTILDGVAPRSVSRTVPDLLYRPHSSSRAMHTVARALGKDEKNGERPEMCPRVLVMSYQHNDDEGFPNAVTA